MRTRDVLLMAVVAGLTTVGPLAIASAQPDAAGLVPAQRRAGPAPALPSPMTVGWVEEAMEVTVDATGRPRAIDALRVTPGSRLLETAVREWVFRPAMFERKAVESRVLVIGVFRPPVMFNGPTLGSPPVTMSGGSREVAGPLQTVVPDYPLRSTASGVSVVELMVSRSGSVDAARVTHSVPGLDTVALDAARQWTFAPAMRRGEPVPSFVYVAFGFQPPVTGGKPPVH